MLAVATALCACGESAAPPAALCVAGSGSVPGVTGPVAALPPGDASRNYPWAATDIDLAARGYVEEEYFFCGAARLSPYTSRMIVRRPTDPAHFNGTVLVEWLNVTAGSDADLLWLRSHEHLIDAGYAYAGVSAQSYGVYAAPNGLKHWSPQRYAQLSFPLGVATEVSYLIDPTSLTIFSQALRALRTPAGVRPLGALAAQTLIVTGGSQSAGAIGLHYILSQPLERLADGYLPFILSLSSLVSFLDSQGQLNLQYPVPSELVRTPYFLVNSETDPSFLRQPDSGWFRLWEVAGSSHVDQDHFLANRPLRLRDTGTDQADDDAACAWAPRSRIPLKYALNAAIDHLAAWARVGRPPPVAPGFAYDLLGQLQRDADGNVLGGLRLPQHAVPTAVNRRENSGSALCSLYGRHQPFDAATLQSRYPTHAQYVTAVDRAVAASLQAGFMVERDAAATRVAARSAPIPP